MSTTRWGGARKPRYSEIDPLDLRCLERVASLSVTVEDERSELGVAPPEPPVKRPKLAAWKRILLFVVGWSVLLVGVAGLVLPGIQGILTILIGAAILSLVSETIYRLLRRLLNRWPWLMERIDRWRHKLNEWLHRE